MEASLKKPGAAAEFAKACTEVASPQASAAEEPQRSLYSALRRACAARNPGQHVQAYADSLRQVEGRTCKLRQATWEDDFDQVDANTWISQQGPHRPRGSDRDGRPCASGHRTRSVRASAEGAVAHGSVARRAARSGRAVRQAINPDFERFMAKRMGATTVEVQSGHLAMISHPDSVAAIIRRAAETVSR